MRIFIISATIVVVSLSSPAIAGPAEDATAAVTTVLDKFNGGDADAFLAVHRDGAVIIDEFAPYAWGGAGSAKAWLQGYGADSAKRGISGGRVDYAKPIQASSDGASAYIVLPTVYSFAQNGKKMAAKGSMTFVMVRTGKDWKIGSWTYSGETPVAQ